MSRGGKIGWGLTISTLGLGAPVRVYAPAQFGLWIFVFLLCVLGTQVVRYLEGYWTPGEYTKTFKGTFIGSGTWRPFWKLPAASLRTKLLLWVAFLCIVVPLPIHMGGIITPNWVLPLTFWLGMTSCTAGAISFLYFDKRGRKRSGNGVGDR
jgi:hypothetical protein